VGPASLLNKKAGAPADLFSYIYQLRMQKIAVLLTLALSFIVPLAIPAAQAAGAGSVHAVSNNTQCRRHGSKKDSEDKPKKKKGKEEKKSYGFEL
jgi:hypothetical protein